jgi:DNA-3-methyladenine glycosylase II
MYSKAKLHFKKADPILHQAAVDFEIPDLKISENLFEDIVWTIVGQQLSGKAADTIFQRLREQVATYSPAFTPEALLEMTDEEMRACGLSGAKSRAIKNLCEKIVAAELDLAAVALLEDQAVVDELTKIKGIGPWTAEMILMFSLGRTDVFSTGDLGLRKGAMELYGLKKLPDEKKLLLLAKKWSPYRTYAARVLYRVADRKKLYASTTKKQPKISKKK